MSTSGSAFITRRTRARRAWLSLIGIGAVAAALGATTVYASPGGKGETLRYYVKDVSMTITHADGTTVRRPPYPAPVAGDVMEVNSLDYKRNHARHAAHWSASEYVRCVFAQGPPDCTVTAALGSSLLIFTGSPGTLVNGTGRYQGATGQVLRLTELPGGADVVARVQLP
jgi:hypothetical protein